MKITPEYKQKMSKAKEIQRLWKPEAGDYYMNMQDLRSMPKGDVYIVGVRYMSTPGGYDISGRETPSYYSTYYPTLNSEDKDIWLPTFENLIDMGRETLGRDFDKDAESILYYHDIKTGLLDLLMEKTLNKKWNYDKKDWEVTDVS